eukprot:SAG31_NODE_3091_length_4683_cov_47.153578_4_plen_86_part_00
MLLSEKSTAYFLVFMGLIEKYGTNRESVTLQEDAALARPHLPSLLMTSVGIVLTQCAAVAAVRRPEFKTGTPELLEIIGDLVSQI